MERTHECYGKISDDTMFIVLGYICRRLYGAWRKVRSTAFGVSMEFGRQKSYWGQWPALGRIEIL